MHPGVAPATRSRNRALPVRRILSMHDLWQMRDAGASRTFDGPSNRPPVNSSLSSPLEAVAPTIAKRVLVIHYSQTGQLGSVATCTAIEIGRAVQQECRDRSRMPSSA
eukprot:TRINITY_DN53364_c0_g1_i3.p1 TRINITY_DN53364_c0_g1~~TRINITY_DN53364_c0_g1_i3.p1  ORF type:complete len:108 (-),score=16.57 TRINITY_DN53364_c0_g1_i3:10-333(-)